MEVNKVIIENGGGYSPIDLTNDTAVESDVAEGKTFHKANGEIAVGTAQGGGSGNPYADILANQSDSYKGYGLFNHSNLTNEEFQNYFNDVKSDMNCITACFITNPNIETLDFTGVKLGIPLAEIRSGRKNISLERAFTSCPNLTSIIIGNLFDNCGEGYGSMGNPVEQVITSCSYLFSGCNKLQSIDLSGIYNISSDCTYMFNGCEALQSITFPQNFKVSNAKNMFSSSGRNLFSMQTLDLSNLITTSNTDMTNMFRDVSTQTLILSPNFVLPTYDGFISSMFSRSHSLTNVQYSGTKDQWKANPLYNVLFDGNNITQTITVTCTDGTLTYTNVEGTDTYSITEA